MKRNKETVPFTGTLEQEKTLRSYLASVGHRQDALIDALHNAQGIYGYLPIEVQKMVARGLGLPLEEVYSVVTFYAHFTLSPKGLYNISVCLGTACYVKGAKDIMNQLTEELGIQGGECTPDRKFSLQACRCIGACGLAPVLTVNDDVYGRLQPEDVPAILLKYRQMGQ